MRAGGRPGRLFARAHVRGHGRVGLQLPARLGAGLVRARRGRCARLACRARAAAGIMSPMKKQHRYPFPAHYVTADIVVFTFKAPRLHVLLVERGNEPFKGKWALPGGFLKPDEELETCARRELAEETSLQTFFLEQFATLGTVGRDPRGRVVTVAWLGLARWQPDVKGGTDTSDARWFPV